jgi:hypothetical protein
MDPQSPISDAAALQFTVPNYLPESITVDTEAGFVFLGSAGGASGSAYVKRFDLDGQNETNLLYDQEGVNAAGHGYGHYGMYVEPDPGGDPSVSRVWATAGHGRLGWARYDGSQSDDQYWDVGGNGNARDQVLAPGRIVYHVNNSADMALIKGDIDTKSVLDSEFFSFPGTPYYLTLFYDEVANRLVGFSRNGTRAPVLINPANLQSTGLVNATGYEVGIRYARLYRGTA